jgi:hypothetical protein
MSKYKQRIQEKWKETRKLKIVLKMIVQRGVRKVKMLTTFKKQELKCSMSNIIPTRLN